MKEAYVERVKQDIEALYGRDYRFERDSHVKGYYQESQVDIAVRTRSRLAVAAIDVDVLNDDLDWTQRMGRAANLRLAGIPYHVLYVIPPHMVQSPTLGRAVQSVSFDGTDTPHLPNRAWFILAETDQAEPLQPPM